jgi:hypothetical protein
MACMAEKFSHAGHLLRGVQVYQKAKDRAKARSAAITLARQDIAPLPRIGDASRRGRADRDFKSFC